MSFANIAILQKKSFIDFRLDFFQKVLKLSYNRILNYIILKISYVQYVLFGRFCIYMLRL